MEICKKLGWFCKDNGITLKEVIEISDIQKGTLESRWKRGKKKEILCIIEGCKVLKSTITTCWWVSETNHHQTAGYGFLNLKKREQNG